MLAESIGVYNMNHTEKINGMLGMTQNMMNISEREMGKEMMPEIYSMTSAMMGNLHHMKVSNMTISDHIMMMKENMMRAMENMMMSMDMNNMQHKTMLKMMMSYMVGMQMSILTQAMK